MKLFSNFLRSENGATAIEYGLIAALIALVIITIVTSVGNKTNAKLTALNAKL